ncbi:MAG: hypothetical protein RL338_1094 [Chloroflexota bacterium]|jgi:hypothetical protein
MSGMQHSIAARNVARTAARFVRSSASSRERRLGLRAGGAPRAARSGGAAPAALDRDGLGSIVRLRARWRAVTPARPVTLRVGSLRRPDRLVWSVPGRRAAGPASAMHPSPWRD